MKPAETLMKRIREKIRDDKAALPRLHERALELDLRPRPWWNRSFYDWAIKRAGAEQGRLGT